MRPVVRVAGVTDLPAAAAADDRRPRHLARRRRRRTLAGGAGRRGCEGTRAEGRGRPRGARAAHGAAGRAHRPGDAVLSEEALESAEDKAARLTSAPRCGSSTRSTGRASSPRPPRDDWAVHVALWSGRPAWSRARWPSRRWGRRSTPARPPVGPAEHVGRGRGSRSRAARPPAFVEALAKELDAELVPMGSAGVKVLSVGAGRGGRLRARGWPVRVGLGGSGRRRPRGGAVHVAGGRQRPLVYNQADVYLPDVIVCRPELAGVDPGVHQAANGTD